ncbi:hypothetical protein ACFQH6_17465 [Halobacteriaceae archaeon GCM10025711]
MAGEGAVNSPHETGGTSLELKLKNVVGKPVINALSFVFWIIFVFVPVDAAVSPSFPLFFVFTILWVFVYFVFTFWSLTRWVHRGLVYKYREIVRYHERPLPESLLLTIIIWGRIFSPGFESKPLSSKTENMAVLPLIAHLVALLALSYLLLYFGLIAWNGLTYFGLVDYLFKEAEKGGLVTTTILLILDPFINYFSKIITAFMGPVGDREMLRYFIGYVPAGALLVPAVKYMVMTSKYIHYRILSGCERRFGWDRFSTLVPVSIFYLVSFWLISYFL